jgi:TnpA family transposase
MSRQPLLTRTERDNLLALPTDESGLIRLSTFSQQDTQLINQHRGDASRLGFAIQLCYLRYPGRVLEDGESPYPALLKEVAKNLKVSVCQWPRYLQRETTRREHLRELYAYLGLQAFTADVNRQVVRHLKELAIQTDQGLVLAEEMIYWLRQHNIIVPIVSVIERVCAEARTLGTRKIYATLNATLLPLHRQALDTLLVMHKNSKLTLLAWLRQPPGKSNAKHVLLHIKRLKAIEALNLPEGIERQVHQNRMVKLSREGGQMAAKDLAKFEPSRRYATLVCLVIESRATLIDEIIDQHDRIMGKVFSTAKRTHAEQLQKSGKAIHAKLRQYLKIGQALVEAKKACVDPFVAIENIMSWESFEASVNETNLLAKRESFDFLELIGKNYSQLRRYTPEMLTVLNLQAAPAAQDIFKAVETLRQMNDLKIRKVPDDVPVSFIPKRWEKFIFSGGEIDRRFYELCLLSELKRALRSGDIWIKGSRQFKNFDDYLMPVNHFKSVQNQGELPLAILLDQDDYLDQRLELLKNQLKIANRLALLEELPEASITDSGLRITPLDKAVPDEAKELISQASSMLPHLKITELLQEVDEWVGFTDHFTHLKNGRKVKDKPLLLTVILADGINLGLAKMAESCSGSTYAKLAWLQAWHIRDETYASALAAIVNAQKQHPLARLWGDGTTSSSDGQNFKTGGQGKFSGQVNLKYGYKPGAQFYTHISDQYSPYHVQMISAGIRDSTHVLDGLLHHESDLKIEEHYTDTAGFTDHVFALMHLLGFRFAPRIRDLNDKRIFIIGDPSEYPKLAPMIGRQINDKLIKTHWDEILRLATSIKLGTVTASLMLRKLGSYPRQNGLALALRELGRLERSLFMLEWIQNPNLRRRVQVGLNKGESRNALARAVFFNRLGEIRDRSFEQQRYRASGLNLVTAAIVLWNTTYLERAIQAMKDRGQNVDEVLLPHLSPLGWEHINLTGNYTWGDNLRLTDGEYRPLRTNDGNESQDA